MRRLAALVLLCTVPFAAAEAQQGQYAACITEVRADPEAALGQALSWHNAGGGGAARHCLALALVALGRPADAARQLEMLARDMGGADGFAVAAVLDQAGLAWLAADDDGLARKALTAALEFDPENSEIMIDRARAFAAGGAYWEAIDDLNRAIDLAPGRPEAYIFRATAWRYLDTLDLAAEDIGRSLALAPGDPVALLERGNIRRLSGDDAGARADWLAILVKTPNSLAALAARANIERLDLKVE